MPDGSRLRYASRGMTIQRREFVAGMFLGGIAAQTEASGSETQAKGRDAGRLAWPPGAGYVSKDSSAADETRWVQVDLGSSQAIEGVKLYPQFNTSGDHFNGEGFPVRFRLEVSDAPEFRSPAVLADHTGTDYPDPADHIQHFPATGHGRYVRLTVTKLRPRAGKQKVYYFSLAKLDVLAGGKDVAQGRPVFDSLTGALGVTALTRAARPQGETDITDNPRNVIPAGAWKRVPHKVHAPLKGVTLDGGPMTRGFNNNIDYLLGSFSADELLKEFRDRAGKPNPPGLRKPDQFWQTDLAGSNAGRFLMGAGNSVRWTDRAELRKRLDYVVDGICGKCRQPNGYTSWPTRRTRFSSRSAPLTREPGLLTVLLKQGIAGRKDAFQLLRGYYDWFDQCKYLPELLRGAIQGVQGMIGNTRMAHTPTGKPKDIQVIQQYFQENYWLDQLAKREERAIWQYPYDRPHC